MTAKISFTEKVLKIVAAIPRGKVLTYSAVARQAGSPGAGQAVGSIMAKNYRPDIPCHRVIRSDGTAGNYNRGNDNKIKKLRAEGVIL